MQVTHKHMEAAKQWFEQDLNIAQLNLEHLDAWEWEINRQLKSGKPKERQHSQPEGAAFPAACLSWCKVQLFAHLCR